MKALKSVFGVRPAGTIAGFLLLCPGLLVAQISVNVNPGSATLGPNQTQQFTADVVNFMETNAVTWSIFQSPGSIDATTGLYTAPSSIPMVQSVTVIATSMEDPMSSGSATITLVPVAVSVSPSSVSLNSGQMQQFTAMVIGSSNTAVTWSVNPQVGSVSSSGLYTAPASIINNQTVTVTATSVADNTASGSASVILNVPISVSVSPPAASLTGGGAQQFTATVLNTDNPSVAWSVNPLVGSISSSGLYTAPATIPSNQSVTVIATSMADDTTSGSASVTLISVSVSVSPPSASLNGGGTQQFTAPVTGSANSAVTWSVNPALGTVSSSGLYTAPASIASSQTVTVTATSVADTTKSGTASVTLNANISVSVSPSAAALSGGATQQFTATVTGIPNTAVSWSVNPGVGSISSSGLYTAPAFVPTGQIVTITATSAADNTKSGSATVTLAAVAVTLSPSTINLSAGQVQQFLATVTGTSNPAVIWTMSPSIGFLFNTGIYTAPNSIPNDVSITVTARSLADNTKVGTASINLTASTVLSVSCSNGAGPTAPGLSYSSTCTASGGTPPYNWSINPGSLPAGLSLSPSTGTTVTVSGGPAIAAAGAYSYGVQAADSGSPAPTTAGQSFNGTIAVPVVSVSPPSLTFNGIANGPSSTAVITVGAGVAGQAFTASAATSSGGNWLRSNATSNTTPGTIVVTADPTGLQPGSYGGSVNISVPFGNPAASTVSVTLVVQPAAPLQLRADPSGLTFALVQSGAPSTRTITVSNGGSGAVQVTASANTTTGGKWLSVQPAGALVSSTAPLTLAVTADPEGLMPGTYSGSIAISPGNVTILVTLTLSGPASQISLSETGFTFFGVAGLAPGPSQTLTVSNAGSKPLNFNATATTVSGGSWLTVSPAAGTPSTGADLQVTASPVNLAPGDYYGSINITGASAANSPQTAEVVLHVLSSGSKLGVIAAPAALVFVQPGSQTISLATSGAGTFKATFADDYGGSPSFFTHSGASGTITVGNSLTVTVQVDTATRKPGIYRGSLIVSTDDGVVQKVTILLVVPDSPTLRDTTACVATQLILVTTTFSQSFNVSAGWPTPIEVQVVDDCGSFLSTGSVVVSFSNSDPPLSLFQQDDGRWSVTWAAGRSGSGVVLTLVSKSRDLHLTGTLVFGGAVISNPLPPVLPPGSVLNGASFAANAPIAPGSIVSIFGSKLAQGQQTASSLPLPLQLSGATVFIAGNQIPLYFTSDGQLNAIVPYGISVNTTQSVIVQRENALSVPRQASFAAAAPGIFSYGANQGIILGVDSSGNQTYADSAHPVSAGQTIVIYCTGLGEVDPPVPAGSQAPLDRVSKTISTVTLTVGGRPAKVSFAGLSPGSTGLYQVNGEVPDGVTPGENVSVVLTAEGQSSAPVVISVR